jgi:DNA transformation protein and related proteins
MMVTHRAAADEFRDYCFELLSSLRQGEIVAKKMFGGTGFSIDGKTFAIIAFDQLWLKVDDESKQTFAEAGCPIFTYAWNDGIERNLGYYAAPDDAMESASIMRPWAMLAWQAALRAAAAKVKKPATKTAKPKSEPIKKTIPKTVAKPIAKNTTKATATTNTKAAAKPAAKKKKT